jgi:hypothetical protein
VISILNREPHELPPCRFDVFISWACYVSVQVACRYRSEAFGVWSASRRGWPINQLLSLHAQYNLSVAIVANSALTTVLAMLSTHKTWRYTSELVPS